MKSKQEVIQEAWVSAVGVERYESIKDELMLDGFLHFQPSSLKDTDTKIIDGLPFYRPKSLQGIENNNGWTEGLPPESMGECWVMTKDMGITIGNTEYMKEDYNRWAENVTHYQPIIKPEAPIY